MLDKNGVEMHTGDVVVISGAYFKNDNGRRLITHSPGDETWLGSEYGLRSLRRDNHLSKGKYHTHFWPLFVTVSDRDKALAAKAHNKEHATIEVVGHLDANVVRSTDRWGREYVATVITDAAGSVVYDSSIDF